MCEFEKTLGSLSSAEEFLDFFGVEYQESVVNVNRLHILKRFSQLLARHEFEGTNESEIKAEYRALLRKAYGDFVESDARTQKVFKVFQDADGVKSFSIASMRAQLAARQI